jgi:hypothetical protein
MVEQSDRDGGHVRPWAQLLQLVGEVLPLYLNQSCILKRAETDDPFASYPSTCRLELAFDLAPQQRHLRRFEVPVASEELLVHLLVDAICFWRVPLGVSHLGLRG